MGVFLTILKWLGIILLILLALALCIILLILLVPFHYKAAAQVSDPESHSEIELKMFKERSRASAEVSWFLGLLRVLAEYPSGDLVTVKVFGKDIGLMEKLRKPAQEEPEEEKEEEPQEEEEEVSTEEKIEKLIDKGEGIINLVDYVYRVLTGSCGRRAWRKIEKRLLRILAHVQPSSWELDGTIGLSEPCLNGRLAGLMAILMTFLDEHLVMDTEWDQYRCDLKAELSGRLRLGVPVFQAVPLVFDKDCRKVYKKLRKAKSKLNTNRPAAEPAAEIQT